MQYNIYCDESCHLEFDHEDIMVLGSITCDARYAKKINADIRTIKIKHGLKTDFEIKWTKVSTGKIEFYQELINYFFGSQYLGFRAVVAKNKSKLNHGMYNQTHDEWYYKMYYYLLRESVRIGNVYRIFVDIKDTRGAQKVENLRIILNSSLHDFFDETVERIQTVRSDEIGILQLTDLILGAISYINRNRDNSKGKLAIVEQIKNLSGYSLKTTTVKNSKFGIFVWLPRGTY